MRSSLRLPAPASWLRLPLRTARLRLTILYTGLFLFSGTVVLAGTYLLATGSGSITVAPTTIRAFASPPALLVMPTGTRLLSQLASLHAETALQHQADTSHLLRVSLAVLGISALASALLGWIAAGRVLRRLRTITTTAWTISAGNLHERLALTGPNDEFKQLGDTLDDLLARLETSFRTQRRFVANASHELRTPLTLERTLLQVALADPDASAASLRATCEELLRCGRDHERMLERC